jgi:endoglycosylceramidase
MVANRSLRSASWPQRVLPALASLGLLAGCSEPVALTPYEPPAEPWVRSDRRLLRDETDRVVVFRGVNARVEGIFDVTFDDGRLPLEEVPTLGPEDVRRMRELGLNLLRLPMNWSGIEPEEGVYDEAYLDRVQSVVELCATAGVHVILDFHQDAYSKEIGEDGAPLWAIHPPPEMLLGGPLGDSLQDRILSPQVQRAFVGFFADDDDDLEDRRLQAAFAAMARHVATRFADEPAVLGYDLYNEPVTSDPYLNRFHRLAGEAIREVDDRHLLLFEPPGTRNFTERASLSREPFFDDGGVYAVHLYTFAFLADGASRLETLEREDLEPNVTRAALEAERWDVPMLVGEWGIGPGAPNMALYVRTMHELFDERFASAAVWLWKEQSQGSWGFYALEDDGTWTERPEVVAAHARVYAERIAGEPTRMHYDAAARRFELAFTGRTDAAPHVLYVPAPPNFAERFAVRCDGRLLEPTPARDAATGRVEAVCGGPGAHTLVLEPG